MKYSFWSIMGQINIENYEEIFFRVCFQPLLRRAEKRGLGGGENLYPPIFVESRSISTDLSQKINLNSKIEQGRFFDIRVHTK